MSFRWSDLWQPASTDPQQPDTQMGGQPQITSNWFQNSPGMPQAQTGAMPDLNQWYQSQPQPQQQAQPSQPAHWGISDPQLGGFDTARPVNNQDWFGGSQPASGGFQGGINSILQQAQQSQPGVQQGMNGVMGGQGQQGQAPQGQGLPLFQRMLEDPNLVANHPEWGGGYGPQGAPDFVRNPQGQDQWNQRYYWFQNNPNSLMPGQGGPMAGGRDYSQMDFSKPFSVDWHDFLPNVYGASNAQRQFNELSGNMDQNRYNQAFGQYGWNLAERTGAGMGDANNPQDYGRVLGQAYQMAQKDPSTDYSVVNVGGKLNIATRPNQGQMGVPYSSGLVQRPQPQAARGYSSGGYGGGGGSSYSKAPTPQKEQSFYPQNATGAAILRTAVDAMKKLTGGGKPQPQAQPGGLNNIPIIGGIFGNGVPSNPFAGVPPTAGALVPEPRPATGWPGQAITLEDGSSAWIDPQTGQVVRGY